MWELGRASDDEALRLVNAFLQISEPERRREIVELAERYQRVTVRPVLKRLPFAQDNFPQVTPPFAEK
jgi:hypothetical protein